MFALSLAAVATVAFAAEGASPAAQARQILVEDGFWDIAPTTGFFKFEGPVTQLPFEKLLKTGSRGGMLGVGTLTEIVFLRSSDPWQFKEVPPGLNLFQYVFKGPELIQRMLWEFDASHVAAREDPRLAVARTAAEVEAARRAGRAAIVLGLDTGAEINEDLRTLRMYHQLGLRKLALVHAAGTSWADSVHSKREGQGGLSNFGQEVVRECNRLGIMVDVSHCSDQTFWDTLAVSTKPLIASHSGARAVAHLSRNLSDEMLTALAAKGGMIGVCGLFDEEEERKREAGMNSEHPVGISAYLSAKYQDPYRLAAALANPAEQAEARNELGLEKSREYAYPGEHLDVPEKRAVIVRTLLDHLDHVVKVVGIDHVGIGTDLNLARAGYPEMIEEIVTGLVERGYHRDHIRKILFENFVKYFRTVTGELSDRVGP